MTEVLPAMLSALPALAGRPAQRRSPTASPEPEIWRVGDQIRFCCRSAPKSCPCGPRQTGHLFVLKADSSICLQHRLVAGCSAAANRTAWAHRQARDEVHWIEDDMGGAVPERAV